MMSRRSALSGVRIYAFDPQRHVLARGQPRQQVGRLENDAAIRSGSCDLASVKHDASLGDIGQPGGHRQHGGLAASGVSDQRDEFATCNVEAEPVDHGQRTARSRIRLYRFEKFHVTCRGPVRPCAFALHGLPGVADRMHSRARYPAGKPCFPLPRFALRQSTAGNA